MCDMGFLPDIRRILQHVPSRRQTLFFSATMPDDIHVLADKILKDPVTVQIGMIAPAETVSHALYPVPDSHKARLLFHLLEQTADRPCADLHAHQAPCGNLAQDLENAELPRGRPAGQYDAEPAPGGHRRLPRGQV